MKWKLISHTVGTESIQTPLNFSLFVILQPFAKIIYTHSTPYWQKNTELLTFLQIYYKRKTEISHGPKYSDPLLWHSYISLRCCPFLLIIIEMVLHLHLSPAVFDYTDWTWLGKPHTCLYKTLQLTVHVRANENHEVKGTAWRAQRQNCGKAQIWPRLQKHFCCT